MSTGTAVNTDQGRDPGTGEGAGEGTGSRRLKAALAHAVTGIVLALGLNPAQANPTVKTLPSGVEVTIKRPGREPLSYPGPTDSVRVHYEGSFEDGRVFDSSYERGRAADLPLTRVIPCWTQGLQQVPVGAEAVLRCPAATAYGERGAGGGRIPPNTPLKFKVELLEVLGR